MTDRQAMRQALDLARRGWGRVAPNPMVGAVVVAPGGQVAGAGFHAQFGAPHAEVEALRAAGENARGADLIVTLEPCRHLGKTPPCTEAILAAGVKRVMYAVGDPTTEARGGGEQLRAAGVQVESGVLADEAVVLNAPFFFAATDEGRRRPFVALKLATSLDGRIADADGQARWISGPEAREFGHWLRAGFDAIAVGGQTALQDDPLLTVRGKLVPRKPPVRVVFDRRAMLNSAFKLVQTAREAPTWVVASREAPDASVQVLEEAGVRVFRPSTLTEGMEQLRQEGIQSLFCEGGGLLLSKLMAEGLVDRLYWV
ncbi:MAG: bifunctional diaminohydroxyphosphoribosylaminopyrimidine deaminase/5-amino-6-(5-phosphoribosylamino)uracil reductase RibD, partial [Anaerolineales bacterium]